MTSPVSRIEHNLVRQMVATTERQLTVVVKHMVRQLEVLGYKDGDTVRLRAFYPDKARGGGQNLEFVFPNVPVADIEGWHRDGRGAYVVVNPGGNKDAEITECRAIFYEYDSVFAEGLAKLKGWFPGVEFPVKPVEPGQKEQWLVPKEVQKQMWSRLGLPEPTMQVDTGGKSIHSYWTLIEPVSQGEWKPLQSDLLEFADADRTLKNPSRVMRVAGGIHAETGQYSLLISGTGKPYSYEQLRSLIPAANPEIPGLAGKGPKPISWAEFNRNFRFPIDDAVPIEVCLSRKNRELLNSGESNGSRNQSAFQVAVDLIATAAHLTAEGQRFSGDPYILFIDFCHRCPAGNGWSQHEWDATWKSAHSKQRNSTLSPEFIENCVKAWTWSNRPRQDALGVGKVLKGMPAASGHVEIEPAPEDATDEEKLITAMRNYVKVSDVGSKFQLYPLRSRICREFGLTKAEVEDLAKEIECGEGGELTSSADVLIDAFGEIEMRSKSDVLPGLPSGFHEIDNMTQGYQPTDFIIVAARPSMGKTAKAVNDARNVAAINKKNVAIFSLEMSKLQIAYRLLSSEASVDSSRLRSGKIAQNEWDRLGHAMALLSNLPIFIDDTPQITVAEIRVKLRRLKAIHGDLGLVIIDYIQLMSGVGENRVQELSKISRSLKALAKELKVPIIGLAQLSRGVESRTNKKPAMSDIKECGQIEQDADLIMMLYREEYYDPDTVERGIAEVIITKHRNGPTGTVKLLFEPQYSRFRNVSTPDYED